MERVFSFLLCCFIGATAQAVTIQFDGDIEYHNDVVFVEFTLDSDSTGVSIWTDSYDDGLNFDPIVALWDSSGYLIDQVDDDDSINANQTDYDSGISLTYLAAGTYTFTIATYDNWALGDMLSDGFTFDSQLAIALADWTQPANSADMGSYWSLWLDGVDFATVVGEEITVSEPGVFALMLCGIAGFAARTKRKVNQ